MRQGREEKEGGELSRLTKRNIQELSNSCAVRANTNDSEMRTVPAPARVVPTFDCCVTTKTRTTIAKTMNDNTLSRAWIAQPYGGS